MKFLDIVGLKHLFDTWKSRLYNEIYEQIKKDLNIIENQLEFFGGYSGLRGKIELDDNKVVVDEANSIFVSANGDDTTGTGTLENPYKTIKKALDTVVAGQTIYVRAGTYTENVQFAKSGTEDNYITLRNYPLESVVLDCTGKSVEAVVDFNYQSYIKLIGLEPCNLTQSSNAIFGILARGKESHLVIANNNIHNINAKSAENGQANGIKIFGLDSTTPCSHILIQNNHIHDCVCGWSEALTVTANSEYVDVINNTIHDTGNIGIDIAGNFGDCSNAELDHARNVFVSKNTVYNCNSVNASCAGLYCDGASNVIFHANKSYNNQVGLELGSEEMPSSEDYCPHNILAINNLVYNNSVRQVGLGGNSDSAGKTFDVKLWNNTIIHPASAEDVCMAINHGDGFDLTNNIIIDQGTWNMFVNSDLDDTYVQNVTFKNNALYSANGAGIGNYMKIGSTSYSTETFQNANFTINNIIEEIILNEDYTLPDSSNLIGAGYFVEEMANYDDLAGNEIKQPVSIGCYQKV